MGRTKQTEATSPIGMPETKDAPQMPAVELNHVEYPDDFEYFDKYQQPLAAQSALAIRPGMEDWRKKFNLKFFRAEQMSMLNGSVKCAYWRPVKKDLAINGLCIAELFVDESDPLNPWDANGLIPYGRCIRTPDGRECREAYLAIRPAQASPAEERVRARNSAEAVKMRHQSSGQEIANQANALAKQHYGQAQDSSPLVYSQLTPYDQEMRENLVTSNMWDGIKAGNKANP